MNYATLVFDDLCVRVRLSAFDGAGAGEWHAMIEIADARLDASSQYASLAAAIDRLLRETLPGGTLCLLKRYFVSDAANHRQLGDLLCGAVSAVQQPPLDGTKAAVWCWFVEKTDPAYRHLFATGLHSSLDGEAAQTEDVFARYAESLEKQGLTLADNVIRTWMFVQGVDTHYADMVRARRTFFASHGLTSDTHYIASTGIEGKFIHPQAIVFADMYAIDGLQPGQVSYLKGASHLNPTHEYGVTFERATAVDYGDRRHIFVSGTASIDNRGQIVSEGNVAAQTDRTLENIGVLLDEGGASWGDVAQMIVYLRDTADACLVSSLLDERFPGVPRVVVWAPVCRPGWLVEIECVAVKAGGVSGFAAS